MAAYRPGDHTPGQRARVRTPSLPAPSCGDGPSGRSHARPRPAPNRAAARGAFVYERGGTSSSRNEGRSQRRL